MGIIDNTLNRFGYAKNEPNQNPTPIAEQKAEPLPVKKAADLQTGAGAWFDIFGGGMSPAFTSFNSQKEQLQAYTDWVFAAAHKIAEEVAAIDLKLFENNTPIQNASLGNKFFYDRATIRKYLGTKRKIFDTKDGRIMRREVSALEEVEQHPLLSLLNAPNPFMTKDEFFEMTILHLELTGDAFWAVNRESRGGEPTELWPLMPHLVSVVPDKSKFIIGYVYTVDGEQIPFNPDDIIHFKYANPMDYRRGMSTVMAAARAIDTDAHAADYNRKFFYNSAQPDAILYTDSEIDEKVFKRLQSEWKETYGGASNAHRTAILENGLKYQQISLSQREMDFLASRNFNRDMILALFGVPKSIIGLDESMSRANAETADYVFTKGKIRPKMLRLVNRITADLAVQFSDSLVLSFTDPVPGDKDFELKQERQLVNVTHTVNEFRTSRGLEPVDGGDELYIASNMLPIAQLSKANQDLEAGELLEEDNNVPSEGEAPEGSESGEEPTPEGESAGRPAAGTENNSSNGSKSASSLPIHGEVKDKDSEKAKKLTEKLNNGLKTSGAKETAKSAKKKDKIESEPVVIKENQVTDQQLKEKSSEFVQRRDEIVDKFEGDFLKASKKRFDEQKKEVITTLKSRFKGYKACATKSTLPKTPKAKLDDLFNADLSIEAWATAFDSIYHDLNEEMGTAAIDYIDDSGTYDSNTPTFTDWLEERTQKVAGSIDEETIKQLRASLVEGISQGETLDELINRIENIYSASAGYRAERIARTESIDASTWSTIEAWNQSGVVEGKMWLTAGDPCAFCESMQQETTFINENFLSVGDIVQAGSDVYEVTYADVIGPPLHPNCRCALIPVISYSGSPLE